MQKNGRAFLDELFLESGKRAPTKEKVAEVAGRYGIRPYEAENLVSFYLHDQHGVKICEGLPCKLRHSAANSKLLRSYPESDREAVSCLGYCDHSPVIMVDGKYYQIEDGRKVVIPGRGGNKSVTKRNTLSSYLSDGGFVILEKAMNGLNNEDIIDFARSFSLKGFGGSGFPAYIKWKAVSRATDNERYLVVNAHEGEPGTFKDRIIIETRPFELIESSFLIAKAIGASKVIIALKYEYERAEHILKRALGSTINLLAERFPGNAFPKISVLRVPGYYVTGEESALLEAIEGKRSEPRLRPPYPAEVGLFGKPTLIDNVETVVYFLALLRRFFYGNTSENPDKAYCLTGDVKNPGAYFLKYGEKAAFLLTEKGGAQLEKLKAVLPGGLSGGILPVDKVDFALDFESVKKTGAGLGTGSMIAISNERCIVDVMSSVEQFFMNESCGKCFPCRLGTRELSDMFSKLKNGSASLSDIENARNIADVMQRGSICGLGQAAAKMYLDSLKYFIEEIKEHANGKCRANVCFEEDDEK